MSTRTSSFAALLLLTACRPAAQEPQPAVSAETIWCGLGGATELTQDCTLERGREEGRAAFVVRHQDGKFRRLVASPDGQNLLAADGADQSQSALKGDRWEVMLGDDRYIVPVNADAPQP